MNTLNRYINAVYLLNLYFRFFAPFESVLDLFYPLGVFLLFRRHMQRRELNLTSIGIVKRRDVKDDSWLFQNSSSGNSNF